MTDIAQPWIWVVLFFLVTVILPLVLLLVLWLLSIPYLWLYPDRAPFACDFEEEEVSDSERRRIARWRTAYNRLNFRQRLGKAIQRSRRRRARHGRVIRESRFAR
jgi:hypothetical protein